jgi:hypothetical protein
MSSRGSFPLTIMILLRKQKKLKTETLFPFRKLTPHPPKEVGRTRGMPWSQSGYVPF